MLKKKKSFFIISIITFFIFLRKKKSIFLKNVNKVVMVHKTKGAFVLAFKKMDFVKSFF
jgi:hypothetical protein